MDLYIPSDWKHVNLLETHDANDFGEALRCYCFVGNCEQRGCYSTFNLLEAFKKIESGEIYEEAKKVLCSECDENISVYHFKIEEKDCWVDFDCSDGTSFKDKICEPFEIVCAWFWDGDGHLYFRYNDRKVENTDCKKDYTWIWYEKEKM